MPSECRFKKPGPRSADSAPGSPGRAHRRRLARSVGIRRAAGGGRARTTHSAGKGGGRGGGHRRRGLLGFPSASPNPWPAARRSLDSPPRSRALSISRPRPRGFPHFSLRARLGPPSGGEVAGCCVLSPLPRSPAWPVPRSSLFSSSVCCGWLAGAVLSPCGRGPAFFMNRASFPVGRNLLPRFHGPAPSPCTPWARCARAASAIGDRTVALSYFYARGVAFGSKSNLYTKVPYVDL